MLRSCDIAILVTDYTREINETEKQLIKIIQERKIPYIIVKNKADNVRENSEIVKDKADNLKENSKIVKEETNNIVVLTSATQKTGIEELKNAIGKLTKSNEKETHLIGDLIKPNDIVVLVTPIDSAAPKGRMIMPQQLAIRDTIDSNAVAVVTKETELEETLKSLGKKPVLVVTDSQVFEKVNKIVPEEIQLTSFSILMARYKGFLDVAVKGAKEISNLKNGSKVLISEGCTHHRQCDDIGTVKLPKWLKQYTNAELEFEWTSGTEFPEDITKYDLIIHCGGCMLNSNEMQYRMNYAIKNKVPFTNYGTAIAYMKGILERSIKPIKI